MPPHVCESEAHRHDHDHDHDHDHQHEASEETDEAQSLYKYIDVQRIRTLNATDGCIVKPWRERWSVLPECQSDSDEQVILIIPFLASVKISSLLIRTPNTTAAPREIKLFGKEVDFDTEVKPLQTLECVDHQHASDVIEYPLQTRQFTNISQLTLFVTSNYGADTTSLWYLGIRGQMITLRQDAPVSIVYEAQANPKDHAVKGTETVGSYNF